MKNKKKEGKIRLTEKNVLLVYLGIWVTSVVVFWVFRSFSIALLYSIVVDFALLPGVSFIISFLLSTRNYFGKWKLAVPLLFGVMHGLNWSMTFGLSNTLVSGNINLPNVEQMIISLILSIIGLIIGFYKKK